MTKYCHSAAVGQRAGASVMRPFSCCRVTYRSSFLLRLSPERSSTAETWTERCWLQGLGVIQQLVWGGSTTMSIVWLAVWSDGLHRQCCQWAETASEEMCLHRQWTLRTFAVGRRIIERNCQFNYKHCVFVCFWQSSITAFDKEDAISTFVCFAE